MLLKRKIKLQIKKIFSKKIKSEQIRTKTNQMRISFETQRVFQERIEEKKINDYSKLYKILKEKIGVDNCCNWKWMPNLKKGWERPSFESFLMIYNANWRYYEV